MSKIRFILCIFLLVVAFPLINLQAQNDSDWKKQLKEIRKNFGLVFQNFNLFPQYTALQNVMLAGELLAKERPDYKQNRKQIHDELEAHARELLAQEQPDFKQNKKQILEEIQADGRELLAKMGLSERANHYPSQLSGGQQQRVAIARALVNNPATIIADEPTGNLDPERSMEIMTLLVKINQLGTTVVVVTHEKDLVNKFGKRVITIDQGRIINDSVGGYVGGHIHE